MARPRYLARQPVSSDRAVIAKYAPAQGRLLHVFFEFRMRGWNLQ